MRQDRTVVAAADIEFHTVFIERGTCVLVRAGTANILNEGDLPHSVSTTAIV